VRDLVVGGDVTFEPFGEVELKGVPGRWTLLRITAVAGQPLVKPLVAGDAAQRRAATSPAVAGRRRLIWASLGVIALVLLAGAAWGTGLFGANPTASPSPSPTLIVRASPTTAPTQGASASPSLSPTPTPPVALVQIDPITNRVVEQVPDVNAKAGQSFLEIASGSLWQFYGDYRLLYLRDLETGEFIKSTQLPNDVWTVQRGFGSIWVAHGDPFTLIDRIDPTSLVTTQKDILPGLRLWDMAVADRAVYLLDSEHVLQELDPVTNKVVGSFNSGSDASQDLRFHDGLLELGVNDGAGQGYIFIDPATHLIVPRPSIPAIWELNFDTSTVNTYDPATDTRGASIGTRDPPQSVATGFGSAWIAAGSIVYRMDEQRIAAQIPMPEGIYAMSIAIDEPSQTVWVANCFGGIGRC